jgi:tetratricopeptide (TPR) repeat protein
MPYQSEIEKLEQRFREKPEQWFAALADAYRKAGEVERALDVVRAGLEKRPNYTSGHIVLGRCLLDQLNDPEAAQAFERVLQLDAENIIALKSLSEIAERQGDGGAARRWLDRLLEVDPMNDEARAALEALEADAVGAPAEEPVYEASRWEEPERPVESVDAGSTVEVEEHRVPVSEVPTGPTEAIDIDDRDVEEAMEEEELELETPELAAKISDEFPVP